jgi:hypothetical protein
MLSAVITSPGAMLPCYFLPVYGNIRKGAVKELVNGAKIKRVRRDVKDYVLDRCKQCVCTLHINPQRALMDKF